MARRLVSMTAGGRLTVPASARKRLGIAEDAQFEVEVRDDALVLRPVVVVAREDAWAYTPEHHKELAKALRDSREGRVRRVSPAELEKLVGA